MAISFERASERRGIEELGEIVTAGIVLIADDTDTLDVVARALSRFQL